MNQHTHPPLSSEDLKYLGNSWITPELASVAKIFRVSSMEGYDLVAPQSDQRRHNYAGLVFPYYWPGQAEPLTYRIRRDAPDLDHDPNGELREKRKYVGETGRPNRLYFCPETPAALLEDTTRPIVITEGEKKTLALWRLATDGRTAPAFLPIGLSGVANWRGRIGKRPGEKVGQTQSISGPLPEWKKITLSKRRIVLLFDADTHAKFQVREARRQLAMWLTKEGARVQICDIPIEANAKGIDDLLVLWPPKQVLQLIESAVPFDIMSDVRALVDEAAAAADYSLVLKATGLLGTLNSQEQAATKSLLKKRFRSEFGARDFDKIVAEERKRREDRKRKEELKDLPEYSGRQFELHQRGILYWKRSDSPAFLSNFTAEIVSDVVRDDGEEPERVLRIRATLGENAREFVLSGEEFARMEWPIKYIGGKAIIEPGYSRELLRSAIQKCSIIESDSYVYTHTGWTVHEDEHVYLHAGGGIGANGVLPLDVELERALRHFHLPPPPTGDELLEAIETSLDLLGIAPLEATLPLYSAIWRAPLGPVDCSVLISGETGSFKSELAALCQQHYGAAMNAKNLPANWSSTGNALEATAHRVKNALLVIDDFAPTGSAADVQQLHKTAERMFRAQGNASGRGRMTSDGKVRTPKPPRGMILATAEDIPRGHSLRARLFLCEISRKQVDVKKLTAAQLDAISGTYAKAFAGYVKWLAPQMADMETRVSQRLVELRQFLARAGKHARTPTNVANLLLGIEQFLKFAEASGVPAARADEMWSQAQKVFLELARQQEREEAVNDPCQQFLEWIGGAMRSGRAHIAEIKTGLPPDNFRPWGWMQTNPKEEPQALGKLIGWIDGDGNEDSTVYLDPGPAYAAAQQFARDSSEHLAMSLATLKRRLKQGNHLLRTDEARQTITVRMRIQGQGVEVLCFASSALTLEKTRQTRQSTDSGGSNDEPDGVVGFLENENPTTLSGFEIQKNRVSACASDSSGTLSGLSGFLEERGSAAAQQFSRHENVVGFHFQNPTNHRQTRQQNPTKNPTTAETTSETGVSRTR